MTDLARSRTTAARIRIVDSPVEGLAGREIVLSEGETWFGRIEGNDVEVPDSSISRRHARLETLPDGRFRLTDAGSANGVWIDGHKVAEVELEPGQRFLLGSTTFELVASSPPAFEPADEEEEIDLDRTISATSLEKLLKPTAGRGLEALGDLRVTAANQPFLLSERNAMWLVESGKVEIFTVGVEEGRPSGARSHFLTAGEGHAFFGLDAESLGFDSGFLAVGKAGSELRLLDLERIQLHAVGPDRDPRLAELVDRWVADLSRRLVADLPRTPEADLTLHAGEALKLEPGKVVSSGHSVLWVELPAAHFLFDGMTSLSYEVEGVLFPFGPGSWVELLTDEGELEFLPRTTEEVIGDSRLWAGLEVFHRVLMECEFLNKRLAVVDEFNRLQMKAVKAEQAREAGLGAIESVLGGTRKWEQPVFVGADIGPIFQACALVAEPLGIQVKRPVGEFEDRSFEEALHAIASSSRFRTRKVALVDDWWNQEQGPLLAQREEDNAPVALIQTGPRSYDYVDTARGERKPLTEELAATLSPFGYSFYRRFADGPLDAPGLIRFALHGLRREFREVAIMGIAVGLLSTIMPAITGMVFDKAIPQADRPLLLQLSAALLLVAMSSSAFKIVQNVAMMRVQSKMDYSAQSAIWDRLLDLPMTFFRNYSAGDLADRAAAIDKIRTLIAGTGIAAILGSFASLFNAVQMTFYSFALAGVAIALTLFYVALTTLVNYLKLRLQRHELERRGRISGLVLQLISGVSKLRVAGAEDHAFRVWATEFSGMRKVAFNVGRIGNLMPIVNGGFPIISSLVIFFTMVRLQVAAAEKGEVFELTTGDFLAFTAAYGIFMAAMQALGEASINLLRVLPIYERLQPILEEEPEVDDTRAAPMRLRGGIEVSNVSFRYSDDGPWILRDVNLKIEPGEFVALVGGSGSGKSTLLKILLGFERPQKGSVYYDGQDLFTLDVRLVRQQIGVVLQESRLLPADIFRNIVGSSSKTLSDAWMAAAQAGLADDIKKMPMGMHTYVSEGGGGFSGGQKQRLMIARALVHKPNILFLDEATSALDNRTQAIVTQSMDRLQATRVVIAHRLSTIVNADRICYLDQGQVAESGSYQELMEKDGLFAELARRQLA